VPTAARDTLRGDDYIIRAGPLGVCRGTVHHSMNMGVAAITTLDMSNRTVAYSLNIIIPFYKYSKR
jgi:hypothetical protein